MVEIDLLRRPAGRGQSDVLRSFLGSDFIPVVAPSRTGRAGETYNVNGDTRGRGDRRGDAGGPAAALTDVSGVRTDRASS